MDRELLQVQSIKSHSLFEDQKFSKAMTEIQNMKFRNCKRDGNCLYRAIAILIFPFLKDSNFRTNILSFKEKFHKAEFSDTVIDWYMESIEDMKSKDLENLSEDEFLLLIAYLRMVCSAEAQCHSEKYQNYILKDLKDYCHKNIDPMEQRAGDLEISILANALKIHIKLYVVLDENLQKREYGTGDIEIKILHTPDHFEPLYC